MKEEKRYYWIKLKTDFFNQETVDLLLSQPNGCQYVVLYQMLCLNTANNDGEMSTRVGEMIVPFNIEKIVRDTKYFDTDTVTVALGLFKKLGLIYEEDGGILRIANIANMVGSESKWAEKKRLYRERKLIEEGQLEDNSRTLSDKSIEYRDKSIEYRDIDKEEKKSKKKSAKRFTPPTIEEVKAYCEERGNNVDPERFVDFYTANGWKVGKNAMKDWKASVRTWEKRDSATSKPTKETAEKYWWDEE